MQEKSNMQPDDRLNEEQQKAMDEFIQGELNGDDAAAAFTGAYKSILSKYGSAPFLLRTGKKGSKAFTLYIAIVEVTDNNKYQIRFENPSSSKSDIYEIKGED